MKRISLIILFGSFLALTYSSMGQRVTVGPGGLSQVPEPVRASLLRRLELYIQAFNSNDIGALYDLVSERTKSGLDREEFLKQARKASEYSIRSFKIADVRQLDPNDFGDDPPPSKSEGSKWIVSGCKKLVSHASKSAGYLGSFEIWLVNGQWYVQRGGLRLPREECKNN